MVHGVGVGVGGGRLHGTIIEVLISFPRDTCRPTVAVTRAEPQETGPRVRQLCVLTSDSATQRHHCRVHSTNPPNVFAHFSVRGPPEKSPVGSQGC